MISYKLKKAIFFRLPFLISAQSCATFEPNYPRFEQHFKLWIKERDSNPQYFLYK